MNRMSFCKVLVGLVLNISQSARSLHERMLISGREYGLWAVSLPMVHKTLPFQ